MEGSGTHLHIEWLKDDASLFGPIALQGKNEALKGRDILAIETQNRTPSAQG
jgi:hypothetical protein